MIPRLHSYQALLNLAEESLRFPAKGIAEIILKERVRDVLEHTPFQDRAELRFSHEGGTVDYIIAVHETARYLRAGLNWSDDATVSDHSLFLVAWLHPLGKILGFNGEPYYVPNILTGNTRSEKRPWKRNPDFQKDAFASLDRPEGRLAKTLLGSEDHIPDGLKALGIVDSRMPTLAAQLTAKEREAIRFAYGPYELGEASRTYSLESRLQFLIHSARIIQLRGLNQSSHEA